MANKFASVTGLYKIFNVQTSDNSKLDLSHVKTTMADINDNSILFLTCSEEDVKYGYVEGHKYIWMNGELYGGNGDSSNNSASIATLKLTDNTEFNESSVYLKKAELKFTTNRLGDEYRVLSDKLYVAITVDSNETALSLVNNGSFYIRFLYPSSHKFFGENKQYKWASHSSVSTFKNWRPIKIDDKSAEIHGKMIRICVGNVKDLMTDTLMWNGDYYENGTYLENAVFFGCYTELGDTEKRSYLENYMFGDGNYRLRMKGIFNYCRDISKIGCPNDHFNILGNHGAGGRSLGYNFLIKIGLYYLNHDTSYRLLMSNTIDAKLSFNYNFKAQKFIYSAQEGKRNKY